MDRFTGISLCAGVGMLDAGLRIATNGKVRPILYCERETFCAANLAWQMEQGFLAEAPIWSDMRTLGDPEVVEYIRSTGALGIVYGGIPCQPWSTAGKQRGDADGRDLWPATRAVVEAHNPALVFIENVPGILTQPAGAFRIRRELEGLGYRVEAGIFSSAEVGGNHLRKRVFILGYSAQQFDNWRGQSGKGRRGEPANADRDAADTRESGSRDYRGPTGGQGRQPDIGHEPAPLRCRDGQTGAEGLGAVEPAMADPPQQRERSGAEGTRSAAGDIGVAGSGQRRNAHDGIGDVADSISAGLQGQSRTTGATGRQDQARPARPCDGELADADQQGLPCAGQRDDKTSRRDEAAGRCSGESAVADAEGQRCSEAGSDCRRPAQRDGFSDAALADTRYDDAPSGQVGRGAGEATDPRRGEQYEADGDAARGRGVLPSAANRLPLCAPARNDYRAWAAVAGLDATLMPSVESEHGRMADGLASRVDRLRAVGNGVDSLVVAYAFCCLVARLDCALK